MIKNRMAVLDAILIHAYWYDIKKRSSLDLANKIQILALKNICKKLNIKNVIISAGKISQNQPAIGYELKRQILLALPKKFHNRIHLYPSQKTTIGEIKKFREICQAQNWKKLAALGVSLHIPRIKKNFSKFFMEDKTPILFFEAEKNLSRALPILQKYRNSREYTLLKFNEQITRKIENVPLIGTPLLEIAGKFSIEKGYFQPKLIAWILDYNYISAILFKHNQKPNVPNVKK